MDSLLYDARATLRRLPKTPWFTLAVVATDLKERALRDDDGVTMLQAMRGSTREILASGATREAPPVEALESEAVL